MTEGYKYKPRDYTRQQKIWQGPEKKKYTTCRLKKRITSKYTDKRGMYLSRG